MTVLLLDVTAAIAAGKASYDAAIKNKRTSYAPQDKDKRLPQNILGRIGELIVARYFDLPYDPQVDQFDKIDVGGKLEVRARSVEPPYLPDLPYHITGEKPHLPYVLVRIFNDYRAEIPGWLYGH